MTAAFGRRLSIFGKEDGLRLAGGSGEEGRDFGGMVGGAIGPMGGAES